MFRTEFMEFVDAPLQNGLSGDPAGVDLLSLRDVATDLISKARAQLKPDPKEHKHTPRPRKARSWVDEKM
jgi:hypothetical protein